MKKFGLFMGVFCVISMCMGILFMVFGSKASDDYDTFIKKAEYTQGVIKDIFIERKTGSRKNSDNVKYRVIVEYIVDGEDYNIEANHYTYSMYEGQQIGVYYDKNNPGKARVETIMTGKAFPVGIGVVFFLIGAVPMVIFILKKRKRHDVIENGICVDAEVVSIDINYNVRVNYSHPYKVFVRCTNPVTGESNIYASHSIFEDVNMYLQPGDTVPIYFDNRNGKKYFIDAESVKNNKGLNIYDSSM